jgi:hypothetical protein
MVVRFLCRVTTALRSGSDAPHGSASIKSGGYCQRLAVFTFGTNFALKYVFDEDMNFGSVESDNDALGRRTPLVFFDRWKLWAPTTVLNSKLDKGQKNIYFLYNS